MRQVWLRGNDRHRSRCGSGHSAAEREWRPLIIGRSGYSRTRLAQEWACGRAALRRDKRPEAVERKRRKQTGAHGCAPVYFRAFCTATRLHRCVYACRRKGAGLQKPVVGV
eukprot:3574315-Pleurochrysis_carterae.AAC.2